MAVVTVSWELGSDGDQIARGLAERLGARLVDAPVLFDAVRAYADPNVQATAPELAERAPSLWERLNEERHRYAVLLRAVIAGFADDGNCVIVGYGGGLLLRGVRHVFNLKTIAPRGLRLERLIAASAERNPQAAREAAEAAIRRTDRDRARHVHYLFHADWADPAPYDLVLNTRTTSVVTAVDLVAGLVTRPEFQPTRESLAVLHDLALASRVEAALMHDPNVWVDNLRVTARGGEVTLSGQVLADEDRTAAESAARALNGVQAVRNEIAVQPPPLTGM